MSDLSGIGKWLVLFGVLTAVLGLFLMALGKVPFLGRLPGDVRIEREGFAFYFPVLTCLVLSTAVSGILWLLARFK